MNHVIIIGYVSSDITTSVSKDERTVARFSMSVKTSGSNDRQFVDCMAFGQVADVLVKYAHKSSRLAINGYLSVSSYSPKGASDNYKIKSYKVVANTVELLNDAPQRNADGTYKSEKNVPEPVAAFEGEIREDDLPF